MDAAHSNVCSWCIILALLPALPAASAQWILSGNENKIALTSGAPAVVANPRPDSLSLLDFSTFPPKVRHIENVPNTVIGPPSNIGITPDGSLALVANSIRVDPSNATNWLPATEIHILDLAAEPPRIVGVVHAGQQPSGLSITRDGRRALVANRGDGTVTLLTIAGRQVRSNQTIQVCTPQESISDVAISPDGKLALASVQKGGYLAVLRLEEARVELTGQKISTYGQPYRCVITSDGNFALTAGQGSGNGMDRDAVTVVDLKAKPIRTVQHVTIGPVPESIEISPDGKLLAAVVMNGSNLAAGHPLHTTTGGLEILARRRNRFELVQSLPVGAIPEGVAFTPDGRHIVVQCHPERALWVFRVEGESVSDTGHRIKVPGMPSSLRAQ